MVNVALAAFLLAFLVPLFANLGGLQRSAQVLLVALAVPFALVTVLCLASALRPGAVGRTARRLRHTQPASKAKAAINAATGEPPPLAASANVAGTSAAASRASGIATTLISAVRHS